MVMRMIVNIIYNPAGILIKSNADERDIHASEKMAANSRGRSLAAISSLILDSFRRLIVYNLNGLQVNTV